MEDKKKLNDKLQHFINEGLSVEDACNILGIDIDNAKLALQANDINNEINQEVETKNILRLAKPRALKALISIGLDKSIDNVSARVAALRSIAEYDENVNDDINKDRLSEIYRKMQEVAKKYDEELRVSKEASSLPSSSTVIIENKNLTTTVTSEGFIKAKSKTPDEELVII